MAHRIQPLHGSMNALTKQQRQDQYVHAQSYASMLHTLMDAVQDYILLDDDDTVPPARCVRVLHAD